MNDFTGLTRVMEQIRRDKKLCKLLVDYEEQSEILGMMDFVRELKIELLALATDGQAGRQTLQAITETQGKLRRTVTIRDHDRRLRLFRVRHPPVPLLHDAGRSGQSPQTVFVSPLGRALGRELGRHGRGPVSAQHYS
jgi:hypothetical protein